MNESIKTTTHDDRPRRTTAQQKLPAAVASGYPLWRCDAISQQRPSFAFLPCTDCGQVQRATICSPTATTPRPVRPTPSVTPSRPLRKLETAPLVNSKDKESSRVQQVACAPRQPRHTKQRQESGSIRQYSGSIRQCAISKNHQHVRIACTPLSRTTRLPLVAVVVSHASI